MPLRSLYLLHLGTYMVFWKKLKQLKEFVNKWNPATPGKMIMIQLFVVLSIQLLVEYSYWCR